jgi:hypothetical protein
VACVASDYALAFEILRVDRGHHLHHVPRFIFLFLVVGVEMHGDVAVIAPHAERGGNEYH